MRAKDTIVLDYGRGKQERQRDHTITTFTSSESRAHLRVIGQRLFDPIHDSKDFVQDSNRQQEQDHHECGAIDR